MLGTRIGRPWQLSGRALWGSAVSLTGLGGCNSAPSQNILGSYFPSWMICALAGLGATVVVRQLLVATDLDKTLPAPLVVYLALTIAFAFATWLVWLD
jgi:YtcA-like protein